MAPFWRLGLGRGKMWVCSWSCGFWGEVRHKKALTGQISSKYCQPWRASWKRLFGDGVGTGPRVTPWAGIGYLASPRWPTPLPTTSCCLSPSPLITSTSLT